MGENATKTQKLQQKVATKTQRKRNENATKTQRLMHLNFTCSANNTRGCFPVKRSLVLLSPCYHVFGHKFCQLVRINAHWLSKILVVKPFFATETLRKCNGNATQNVTITLQISPTAPDLHRRLFSTQGGRYLAG